jgi:hypothetical protein
MPLKHILQHPAEAGRRIGHDQPDAFFPEIIQALYSLDVSGRDQDGRDMPCDKGLFPDQSLFFQLVDVLPVS